MELHLSEFEARVIGCLIEKEITTPEQYPLSLNALTNACNQKSNRDPVLELDERTVQQLVDGLGKKHLVMEKSGFGSRVVKYQHRFCNSEFGRLRFSEQELGIICELLLRGAQTPGELRAHAQRLCRFSDVEEVEETLTALTERADGPFVMRLPREPGRRESRYAHLFSGEVQIPDEPAPAPAAAGSRAPSDRERIAALEQAVTTLRAQVEELQHQILAMTEGTGVEDSDF